MVVGIHSFIPLLLPCFFYSSSLRITSISIYRNVQEKEDLRRSKNEINIYININSNNNNNIKKKCHGY